jgi:UDP-N-acetylglucosamine--N-acetylmuramyl-(pentapeptide) pyrophosphoryl-undecaprenol N-acetylglucosamine transferase
MTRCIAIAVGDTAGHVMPAIAIAEAYRQHVGPVDVRFFAAGEGPGHWLVEQAGYPLDYVPGSPIARVGRLQQGAALVRTTRGVVRARSLLLRRNARLVIGTGGYGSASALIAGRSCGLTTALVEPNVVPGLTNRLLGRVVDRAYVAFHETTSAFPAGRAIVTGVPSATGSTISLTGARRPPALPHLKVLVTSGSRGEDFMGAHVPPFAQALQRRGLVLEVRHQGGSDTPLVQRSYEALGVSAVVQPFIHDMADALAWADVMIARAGAGTLAELGLAGVPALLVPLADAADDHQASNAMVFVKRGAALWTREQDWNTEALAEQVSSLVRDKGTWERMSAAMAALATPDAASRIVCDCESMMAGLW